MSPTCRRDTAMLANFSRNGMSQRHKTCKKRPQHTQFIPIKADKFKSAQTYEYSSYHRVFEKLPTCRQMSRHCHIARDVRVTEMYRVEGQSTTAHNVNRRARRHGLAVEITVVLCANGRSRLNVGNMSSNVVLFRHSSQDAMSLSRRHDQRHVAGTTHHVCK